MSLEFFKTGISQLDHEEIEFIPMPIEGWHEPCTFEQHKWTLEAEDGRVIICCVDPCDITVYDPCGPTPSCHVEVYAEDFTTPEPIPVKLIFIDDSTPGGPWGPAEYGFYIEVRKGD